MSYFDRHITMCVLLKIVHLIPIPTPLVEECRVDAVCLVSRLSTPPGDKVQQEVSMVYTYEQ